MSRLQSLGYVLGETDDSDTGLQRDDISPRELIEIHNAVEKIITRISSNRFDEGKILCHKMLKKWPDMTRAHFYLGKIALLEQDSEAIVDHFSAFVAGKESGISLNSPDYSVAHTNIGVVFAGDGKLEQAAEHYKMALLYNPDDVITNFNLAGIYLRKRDIENAVMYFTKTLTLDPEMVEANHMMGGIRLKQGHLNEAIAHLTKALSVNPEIERAQESLRKAKSMLARRKGL